MLIFDKAYVDFEHLADLSCARCSGHPRKDNMQFQVSRVTNRECGQNSADD